MARNEKKIPEIDTKRVYEPAEAVDGFRVLVDRVWPRGLSKDQVAADRWLKELAPSTDLRKWFGHDPEKWSQFKERYFEELKENEPFMRQLLDEAGEAGKGRITLLYASRDVDHNQAVALREYLVTNSGAPKR